MKRSLLVAGAAFAAVLSARAVEVDGIAARVGSEAILRSDVMNELRRMGEAGEARFAEARDELIARKLVLKAAADAKMSLQDWMVENRVREIVARAFDGDRNKLVESLARQKISYPEWFARLKEDMIAGAMRWNVVDRHATASPAAMRREYAEHPDRYMSNHRVTASVIQLKPGEEARRAEIDAALADGSKTFEELGGHRYEGVDPEEVFKPRAVEALAALAKGGTSGWVEIDGWSFLLRKEAETSGERLSFEDAYAAVEATVREQEAKRLYAAWIERLRAETFVRTY